MRASLAASLVVLAFALSACDGTFDQRVEVARTIASGSGSTGTNPNPASGLFVRGTVSIAGAVKNALVMLRPVNDDGSIDFDDSHALGVTVTFSNGIYQAIIRDKTYRGPIVVDVRGQNVGGVVSEGANPATSTSDQWHEMTSGHTLYGVLPYFYGKQVGDVNVTPLTTCAVTRGLFFGGVSAGMYGMCTRNVGDFFGIGHIRTYLPYDFARGGSFGDHEMYAYVMAALSQVAKNIGVTNVFDFYEGMSRDCLDDGELNGSIGFVPNTGIAMPDLSAASILGDALNDDYLAPGNVERVRNPDNTGVSPGSTLANLITALTAARDINSPTYTYDLVLRVESVVGVNVGGEYETSIFAMESLGGIGLECYGDSGGPSFVDYSFVSSSPANVTVLPFGRISAPIGATPGTYTLTLTVSPAIAQTLVTGSTRVFTITVHVQ
ncbi:hypothetical protein PLCT1_01950 [Planctomycetaceae bacterium]|nr:hypothetical protein PLCT1_01950 [Planctomycetaceae bacterium]